MKWQVYNKEEYSEIYFRGDTPRSFSEWETVVQANPNCVYWLSPNAFISGWHGPASLRSAMTTKKNFPQCYLGVRAKSKLLEIWATTEMEAFRTLYEMTLYRDFRLFFTDIYSYPDETNIKIPTLLLKRILKKTMNHVWFRGIDFVSEYAGRVLASSGRSKTYFFDRCVFQPPAEEAFVDEMLSKVDKDSGCTGIHLSNPVPFSSDEILVRLLDGQVLKAFNPNSSPISEQVLISLRNNLQLQSLALSPTNFTSFDDFAGFISSLHSRSIRSLRIYHWEFDRAAFPVEIFHKLLLTEFKMCVVYFNEAGWKSMRQEIPKCKTLLSLGLSGINWWTTNKKKVAELEFAVEFAQLLKKCPNIIFTNLTEFFFDIGEDVDEDDPYDDGSELYATRFAPILKHNRLMRNLKLLRRRENTKVRGFLMAEMIGRQHANKPSSCYTVLEANVDVLISHLPSVERAQQSVREGIDSRTKVVHNRTSMAANKHNKRTTPSKRKR